LITFVIGDDPCGEIMFEVTAAVNGGIRCEIHNGFPVAVVVDALKALADYIDSRQREND
jgi:hypothetical protein